MKIRQTTMLMYWLFLVLAIVIFYATLSILRTTPAHANLLVFSKLKTLSKISSSLVEFFIAAPFFYYCSYKKPGTKLLFCSIIWNCFGLVFLALATTHAAMIYLIKVRNLGIAEQAWNRPAIFFAIAALAILAIYKVVWIYCCIKLRKYNFKWADDRVKNNTVYQNRLNQMKEVENMNMLDAIYSASVQEFPELEKYLTQAYEKKKAQLI